MGRVNYLLEIGHVEKILTSDKPVDVLSKHARLFLEDALLDVLMDAQKGQHITTGSCRSLGPSRHDSHNFVVDLVWRQLPVLYQQIQQRQFLSVHRLDIVNLRLLSATCVEFGQLLGNNLLYVSVQIFQSGRLFFAQLSQIEDPVD